MVIMLLLAGELVPSRMLELDLIIKIALRSTSTAHPSAAIPPALAAISPSLVVSTMSLPAMKPSSQPRRLPLPPALLPANASWSESLFNPYSKI